MSEHFVWSEERQKADEGINEELLRPSPLLAIVPDRPLFLYISHTQFGVNALLCTDR